MIYTPYHKAKESKAMHVLVLGCKGMAGHVIYKDLKDAGHTVKGTSRHANSFNDKDIIFFDALQRDSWSDFFAENKADIVINCIGLLVAACESSPSKAIIVNSLLPKYLEQHYYATSTKVIHISTDCVFSGAGGAYSILDMPDESNVYGLTKAAGEINNEKDLTIRTSIIGLELSEKPNASENSGLLHWFLSNEKNSTIQGYAKCYWSGISTIELSNYICKNLLSDNGIIQLCRETKISKLDLLKLANEVFEAKINILPDTKKHVDKSLVPTHIVDTSYKDMLSEIRNYGS